MRIQTAIDALLNAFARRRREDHTTALFAGAANTPGITIIAADLHHARNLEAQHHGPTYLPLSRIDKLIGHSGPIAIDHHAIQTVLAAANHEIEQATSNANKLTNQLAEARDQVHNANLRADRALRDRNEVGARLATLEADVRALLTETDQQQELHAFDRHIAHVQRKIDFFHKHQELLKPRPSHEDDAGATAASNHDADAAPLALAGFKATQPVMRCRDCGKPMAMHKDSVPDTVIRWECPCGTAATRHKRPGEP